MTPQEKAEAIRQMQQTSGWSIVESFLASKITYNKDQLMTCLTMEDVVKHRAVVKAHEAIGVHLNEIIQNSIEENENEIS